jgi:flagellar hook protein FlgE
MVSTALYTGLSGLRAHQTYIDVIGNNLANVSTPGFRGSRATFSDLLSFTVRAGAGPGGNFGGTNPLQIGYGAVMSTVDTDLNQGTLQDTGRSLDVALQGRGFFTLTNGLQTFYSRVGAFGIDANRTLVDLRSGLRVVGSTGANISVPVSDTLPARPTTQVSFQGNLPARVGGPLAEIVQSNVALQQGTAASKVATGTAGAGNQFDLSAFAGRTVLVSVNGGAQQSVTFPTATFGAGPVNASTVAAAFSLQGLQVTADDTAGTINFDTVRLGTSASLKFDDGPSASGLLAAMGLNATLQSGTATTALATTDLSSMTSRTAAYAPGDNITISGTNPDGTVFSDTFVYGTGAGQDGTTLGAMITFLNGTINSAQATAELTSDGQIRLVATNKAEASMSLFIGDAAGNTGSNGWPNFEISQDGTGPDTAVTSIEIVDAQGRTHPVTMTFTRSTIDSTIWDLQAVMDPTEGTLTQATIGQIRFNDNGSFNVIGGGTNALSFSWSGISGAQAVTINLGSPGQFDGVAQLGNSATVAAIDQDGFGAGTLLNAGFNNNGQLVGFYSNGQNQVLDTLRISMFSNEGGLLRSGDTLFVESPNSDDAIATTANSAGAGSVSAGQLENSNVDIAREFVNLIEAQRGFQANSRVITTTDEILAELMNIVR